MSLRFYESEGARLAYRESGSGLPVIFLHPTPLDHFYWNLLLDRLSDVHAIVPDLRGHGASELGANLPTAGFARAPDAPTLTMAQLGSDILALLDHLAVASAVFVGCSIGGYVMLELWRHSPQRMRGLGFVCSKPQADVDGNLVKRADTIAKARAGNREALFDGMAQSSIGPTARTRRPAIVQELRARMTLTTDAIVAVQAGLAARSDSVATVATITVPVLSVAGGEDFAVSPPEMEAFRAAPGGCVSHVLSDAGHFSAYEQPDRVGAFIADWLRSFAS
ncbi:MAG: alpha/beta fold hydrolase [Terracidiphilus sp.]